MEALSVEDFAGLDKREAPEAEAGQLARAHSPAFVEALLDAVPEEGRVRVDADTVMSADSGEASLRAAGAMVAAVEAVMGGQAANAFCAVRPPGHHAESRRSMGFCLFNNVAVGALHAREALGADRVAVVDFDVHHGNGTQAIFETDPSLFFASTHEFPLYPGTGRADETGLRQHRQRAAAPRIRFGRIPRRDGTRRVPRAAGVFPRFDPRLRRFSTPMKATRWRRCAWSRTTMRGSANGFAGSPTRFAAAVWWRRSKAATTSTPWRRACPSMSGR